MELARHPSGSGSPAPPIERSLARKVLPTVLSLIAGSVDVISFVGLGGLFTAHITGNLVILAAHVVSGGDAPLAVMLSVPAFMVVLVLTRLLAAGLEAIGLASLWPLLLLQFLLLGGFLVLGVAAGPHIDPNSANAILAGMLGVSAMAVQNTLPQISLDLLPENCATGTVSIGLRMPAGRAPRCVGNGSRKSRSSGS